MKIHKNAKLTLKQREEVKLLHQEAGWSYRKLAVHFHVNVSTIQKWVKRENAQDKVKSGKVASGVLWGPYREAVIAYRHQNPHHGPIRIALALKGTFAQANSSSVQRILQAERLSSRKGGKKSPVPSM